MTDDILLVIRGKSQSDKKNTYTWDQLDPDAEHDKNVRGSTVNLRLNEWELEVFRHLAKQEKRTLQSYLLLTLKKHALRKVKKLN